MPAGAVPNPLHLGADGRRLPPGQIRAINRAVHYAARSQAATTALDRAAVAFGQWQALLHQLPHADADQAADHLTALINAEITLLTGGIQ